MPSSGSNDIKIEKQRFCPAWTDNLKYEAYRKQVENWSKKNKNDEVSKYFEVLESLKKNDKIQGLSEYVANTICEKFKDDVTPSIEKLIKCLDDRFLKTAYERVNDFLEDFFAFSKNDEKDPAKYFDKLEVLSKKFVEEKLNVNPNFLFMCMLLRQGKNSNLLSDTDCIMLKKVFTTSDGSMLGTNDSILEEVRSEFKRLKIEGQRLCEQNSHFTQNNGGFYGHNRPSRRQSRFVPSSSKPDLWRRARTDYSRNRPDARSQSSNGRRFQPNQRNKNYFDYRDRSASASSMRNASTSSRKSSVSRSSENSIEKKIDRILERLNNLESKASFSNDVGFAEAEEVDTGIVLDNVFYVTDEVKTSMIVDGGCPSTLSGKEVLDRYLSENNIQYKDLPTRKVNMIFKFGETKLKSDQVIDVPIKVKVVDEHGNVGVHYTEVSTYRVNGKVPYLLGLNTMEAWKAKLDMGDKKGLEICLDNGTKFLKILTPKDKTHMKIGLQPLKEKSLKQSVMFLQKEVVHKTEELVHHVQLDDLQSFLVAETINYDFLSKFHRGSGHKSVKNMMHSLSQANVVTPETHKVVKSVVASCKECKKFGRSLPRPKTTLPKVCDTNQIITWDLKEWNDRYILWLIDSFSRFVKGIVIPNKKKETILKALYYDWCCQMGYPTQGFWADNGGEFRNATMIEFVEKCKLSLTFGPSHSPWSNGINERNHGICDVIVKKALETDRTLTLQEAVNIASWSHNTNVNRLGYSPMQLQLGKAVTLPGFTEGSIVTDSKFESELVEKLILNAKNAIKNFSIENFRQKISEAVATRVPKYKGRRYENGEEVYIQREDEKRWSGPVKVVLHEGSTVWVIYNGNLIKLAECRVQPVYDSHAISPDHGADLKSSKVSFNINDDNCTTNLPEEATLDQSDDDRVGVQTRSMAKVKDKNNHDVNVYNFYTQQLNHVCLDSNIETVMTVEIPVKEHGRMDCIEAKQTELQNLLNFETFEEIPDKGQSTIQSRWVLTEKQAHDGQKRKVKGRLVAKGFQEEFKPQSDSPTVLRDSLKTVLVVAANEKHHIASVDITGAFLQGEKLDREVFVKPPPDVMKERPGFI